MESRGVILFNSGEKCICRAIVCLYTLRKHYDGPVTFYLEPPYPDAFDEVCKYFNVDVIHNEEKTAGEYRITRNGKDQSGHQLSTGVYLYRIQAGDVVQTKKMLLLK